MMRTDYDEMMYIREQKMRTIENLTYESVYLLKEEISKFKLISIPCLNKNSWSLILWCEEIRWKFIREDLVKRGLLIEESA